MNTSFAYNSWEEKNRRRLGFYDGTKRSRKPFKRAFNRRRRRAGNVTNTRMVREYDSQ